MHCGLLVKNPFGVQTVLDRTRPFKFLGRFTTRADVGSGHITDDRIVGKDIAVIPMSNKLVSAGSNSMYRFPSSLAIAGNQIQWTYSKLKPTAATAEFHGLVDNVEGTDALYETTFVYGYF